MFLRSVRGEPRTVPPGNGAAPRRGEGLRDVPPRGLEPGAASVGGDKDLQNRPARSGAVSGAVPVERPPAADPGLAQVVTAWPDLPQAVKAGIVAMVKAAKDSKP